MVRAAKRRWLINPTRLTAKRLAAYQREEEIKEQLAGVLDALDYQLGGFTMQSRDYATKFLAFLNIALIEFHGGWAFQLAVKEDE